VVHALLCQTQWINSSNPASKPPECRPVPVVSA
jgi:hypothetical protein